MGRKYHALHYFLCLLATYDLVGDMLFYQRAYTPAYGFSVSMSSTSPTFNTMVSSTDPCAPANASLTLCGISGSPNFCMVGDSEQSACSLPTSCPTSCEFLSLVAVGDNGPARLDTTCCVTAKDCSTAGHQADFKVDPRQIMLMREENSGRWAASWQLFSWLSYRGCDDGASDPFVSKLKLCKSDWEVQMYEDGPWIDCNSFPIQWKTLSPLLTVFVVVLASKEGLKLGLSTLAFWLPSLRSPSIVQFYSNGFFMMLYYAISKTHRDSIRNLSGAEASLRPVSWKIAPLVLDVLLGQLPQLLFLLNYIVTEGSIAHPESVILISLVGTTTALVTNTIMVIHRACFLGNNVEVEVEAADIEMKVAVPVADAETENSSSSLTEPEKNTNSIGAEGESSREEAETGEPATLPPSPSMKTMQTKSSGKRDPKLKGVKRFKSWIPYLLCLLALYDIVGDILFLTGGALPDTRKMNLNDAVSLLVTKNVACVDSTAAKCGGRYNSDYTSRTPNFCMTSRGSSWEVTTQCDSDVSPGDPCPSKYLSVIGHHPGAGPTADLVRLPTINDGCTVTVTSLSFDQGDPSRGTEDVDVRPRELVLVEAKAAIAGLSYDNSWTAFAPGVSRIRACSDASADSTLEYYEGAPLVNCSSFFLDFTTLSTLMTICLVLVITKEGLKLLLASLALAIPGLRRARMFRYYANSPAIPVYCALNQTFRENTMSLLIEEERQEGFQVRKTFPLFLDLALEDIPQLLLIIYVAVAEEKMVGVAIISFVGSVLIVISNTVRLVLLCIRTVKEESKIAQVELQEQAPAQVAVEVVPMPVVAISVPVEEPLEASGSSKEVPVEISTEKTTAPKTLQSHPILYPSVLSLLTLAAVTSFLMLGLMSSSYGIYVVGAEDINFVDNTDDYWSNVAPMPVMCSLHYAEICGPLGDIGPFVVNQPETSSMDDAVWTPGGYGTCWMPGMTLDNSSFVAVHDPEDNAWIQPSCQRTVGIYEAVPSTINAGDLTLHMARAGSFAQESIEQVTVGTLCVLHAPDASEEEVDFATSFGTLSQFNYHMYSFFVAPRTHVLAVCQLAGTTAPEKVLYTCGDGSGGTVTHRCGQAGPDSTFTIAVLAIVAVCEGTGIALSIVTVCSSTMRPWKRFQWWIMSSVTPILCLISPSHRAHVTTLFDKGAPFSSVMISYPVVLVYAIMLMRAGMAYADGLYVTLSIVVLVIHIPALGLVVFLFAKFVKTWQRSTTWKGKTIEDRPVLAR